MTLARQTIGPPPLSTTKLANYLYKRPDEFLELASFTPGVTEIFTAVVAIFPDPPIEGNGYNKYSDQISGAISLSAINNVALHCDVTNSGTFTVDWGDGNTEAYSTGSNVYHVYNYDDLHPDTEFRGYRQAVLSAYPTNPVNKFQEVKTDLDGPFVPSYTSSHNRSGSNLLDIAISSGNATSMDIGGQSRPHKMCERVGLYNTTSNRLTNSQNAFYSGMNSLQDIPEVPYMHVDTTESHAQAFRFCMSLRGLNDQFADPDRYWFWNSSSFYLCFDYCYELEYLPEGLFDKQGQLDELTNCTDFRYMFRYCQVLKYIPRLPVRTTGSDIRVAYMFNNCFHLCRLPDDFRANTIGSGSDGIRFLFYNTLYLEDMNDFSLLDLKDSLKGTDTIRADGMMLAMGRYVNETIPWLGLDPYTLNNRHDIGGSGIYRNIYCAKQLHPEYFRKGYLDFTRITDGQDAFNSNYLIQKYPVIQVSPNTMTNSNAVYRMFFQNWRLDSVTFSGFAANETFGNGEYYQMFYNCTSLKSISGLPFAAANDSGDYSGTFSNAYAINHFTFPGLSSEESGFSESISLRYMPLNVAEIENIFRYLETVGGKTITLTNNNYADEIPANILSIATDKGWTVTT